MFMGGEGMWVNMLHMNMLNMYMCICPVQVVSKIAFVVKSSQNNG